MFDNKDLTPSTTQLVLSAIVSGLFTFTLDTAGHVIKPDSNDSPKFNEVSMAEAYPVL